MRLLRMFALGLGLFVLLLRVQALIAQNNPPTITVTSPGVGAVLPPGTFTVSGNASGLPTNTLFVQVLGATGSMLSQQTATVNTTTPQGAGDWQTTITITPTAGATGTIYAFVQSPTDGGQLAQVSVPVTFGAAPTQATPTATATLPGVPPTQTLPTPTATPSVTPPGAIPVTSTATVAVPTPTVDPASPTPPTVLPPAVSIELPVAGETVSTTQILVRGAGSGLPENNVIVQALDASGGVLAEGVATVAAPLAGTGTWTVTLSPNATAGVTGTIYARSTSPTDGSVLAEARVNVVYGGPAQLTTAPTVNAEPTLAPPPPSGPQPTLRIDLPLAGEIVEPGALLVSGLGAALPGNTVLVQAWDRQGALLDEATTTVDALPGESGIWQVTLQPAVTLGAQGTIYASTQDPTTGDVVAEAQVNVQFGLSPLASTPLVQIEQPAPGATVETRQPFTVSGTANGIWAGAVTVRVRNAFGQTVYEAITTAGPAGDWQLTLDLLIADGATGSIYAFATSPEDERVLIDDLVRVTFSSDCLVRTDWPRYTVQPGDTLFDLAQRSGTSLRALVMANCLSNPNLLTQGMELHLPRQPAAPVGDQPPVLTITAPQAGTSVSLTTPISITGQGQGIPEGGVLVRALDNTGQVLDETHVTPSGTTTGDAWSWTATLRPSGLPTGTQGTLFAYAPSPVDGSLLVSTTAQVSYGPVGEAAWITIDQPQPYAQLAQAESITIRGRASSRLENNVVVQVLDDAGGVLLELPTTAGTGEAGGERAWELTLPIIWRGRGQIRAYVQNAAEAAIDVVFGNPRTEARALWITHPLPNTLISGNGELQPIAGYVSGLFVDQIDVLMLDANGRVLFSMPAPVDRASGRWVVVTSGKLPILQTRQVTIQAIAPSPTSGQILAQDQIPAQVAQPAVTGSLLYLEQVALPPTASITVRIVNAASPEAAPLGEQTITGEVQAPIAFAIPYNPAAVEESITYRIDAQITDEAGARLFATNRLFPVITQGARTEGVEVLLEPVQAGQE
jgi:uncharacterized lipoprotein YbaY/LysM repeat protein